jgi:hypothetical protein
VLYYAIQNKHTNKIISDFTIKNGKTKYIMATELRPPLLIGHSKGLLEFNWNKLCCDNRTFKVIEVEI